MNSFGKIQRFSKIGMIFSEIAFLCFMIGFLGCVVGLLCISIGTSHSIRIGNVVLNGILDMGSITDEKIMSHSFVTWMVNCAEGVIISLLIKTYFLNHYRYDIVKENGNEQE